MAAVRPAGALGTLGLILPTFPQGKTSRNKGTTSGTTQGGATGLLPDVGRIARTAEALGAGALWACDHLYWSGPAMECLTAVTVAATATRRVPVGSCVLQLPLRSAPVLAKQASTLQILSGGRFVLGVGVGSHPGEYEAAGVDFATRGQAMDAALGGLRVAWATAVGGGDHTSEAGYRQLPASDPVPIWIGGSSTAALRRAAREGDGWIPMFLDAEAYGERLAHLRALAEAHGRPTDSVLPAVVVFLRTGDEAGTASSSRAAEQGCAWLSSLYRLPPKAFARHLLAGTAERCATGVGAYLEAGAQHVAVMVADDDPLPHLAAVLEALRPPRRRGEGPDDTRSHIQQEIGQPQIAGVSG
jgi:alkanesulfonate monooxygenase SsuD/methylene tetrahydromethanopterin reductase-like flavin-dependent oxidoreductase (luciferase family)